MNRGVEQNEQSETIARAIWESNAIMARVLTDRCETQLLLIRLLYLFPEPT
jgi:hypothetical protein